MKHARVALVHDWLTGMRGGEYVLAAIAELFRAPELFTLLHVSGSTSARLEALPLHTSRWLRWPAAERYYRHCLPLLPLAVTDLDVSAFDLVVSSSHCVAKGVRKREGAVHVSYVHAPMRYMWDRFDDYFGPGRASLPVRSIARLVRPPLQAWDRRVSAADRVDVLIANSHFIGQQIERAYRRVPEVIHPFADLSRFNHPRRPGERYLMVGAFAPNKRVDLAIEAFNRLRLPLSIVGSGQDERRLRAMAGPTIEFLGAASNAEIEQLYSSARAFIFPGVEDFGITPLEAMASGTPVIAFGQGGALETVVDGKTGFLFFEQTADALASAVSQFERSVHAWDEQAIRERARQFTKPVFQARFLEILRGAWHAATGRPEALEGALA